MCWWLTKQQSLLSQKMLKRIHKYWEENRAIQRYTDALEQG